MPHGFDQRTAASAKNIDVAGERVAAQAFLHQQRQTLHAFTHIGVTRRDPDPNARCDRDHRSARKVVVTNAAGAVALILTRAPLENSTVIATASGAAEAGSSTTIAGANAAPLSVADVCRRHL